MKTYLVLLGTGTPNACPNASGPSSAVVVGDRAYLVDFGPGVVRQASKAYYKGIDALRPDRLTTAFCTHLHTDHTAGYADAAEIRPDLYRRRRRKTQAYNDPPSNLRLHREIYRYTHRALRR